MNTKLPRSNMTHQSNLPGLERLEDTAPYEIRTRYAIRKRFLNTYTVHYFCPRCGGGLKSPLSDAGKADSCPDCLWRFIVPGSKEWERIQEERRSLERQKEAEVDMRRERRRSQWAATVAEVRASQQEGLQLVSRFWARLFPAGGNLATRRHEGSVSAQPSPWRALGEFCSSTQHLQMGFFFCVLVLVVGSWFALSCVNSRDSQPDTIRTESPSATQDDSQSVTVYVTRTGKKYHRASCRYLRKSKIPMPLSRAKEQYGACSVCSPPR